MQVRAFRQLAIADSGGDLELDPEGAGYRVGDPRDVADTPIHGFAGYQPGDTQAADRGAIVSFDDVTRWSTFQYRILCSALTKSIMK